MRARESQENQSNNYFDDLKTAERLTAYRFRLCIIYTILIFSFFIRSKRTSFLGRQLKLSGG